MQWITVNGLSTRYDLAGHGAVTVVMLHEIGGSLESWDAVAPALSQRYRILRYDQRGAGLSEKVRAPFRFEELVDDLEQLLMETPVHPPYYLLGAAAGAGLAMLFAVRHPAWVEKLALCNPAITVNDRQRMYLQERAALTEREGMRAALSLSLANSYPDEVIDDRTAYETYKARFLANDPTCYSFMNRALMAVDLSSMLAHVQCSTLLLAGSHDLLRPPATVAALAKALPEAQFKILSGGHLLPVQAPEPLLTSVIHFFAATAKGGQQVSRDTPDGKEEA